MLFKHLNDALSWRLVAKHAWPCVEHRSASGSGQSNTTAKETQKSGRNFVFFCFESTFSGLFWMLLFIYSGLILLIDSVQSFYILGLGSFVSCFVVYNR